MKQMVSSTDSKWEMEGPSLPSIKPSKKDYSSILNINTLKVSATRVNKKGDKGSPCLILWEELKKPFDVPFIITEKWG